MKKIRNKILLSITFLLIVIITGIAVTFNTIIKDIHLNIIKREMNEKIDFINILIKDHPGIYTGKINRTFSGRVSDFSKLVNLRITIINYDGIVIADSESDPHSMDNHRYRIEIQEAIDNNNGESIRYSNTINVDMLYAAKKFDNYVIRLAKSLHEIGESQKKFTRIIFGSGLFIIIIALVILIIISNKITNPIREVRNFALALTEGDYSKRMLNFSNDEIGILQRTLNKMADRIVQEMNLLITEQNKLKVTFESISDGIAVIDINKKIIMANKAFASLMDINVETATGKIYFEAIRGSLLNKNIEHSIETGEAFDFQEKLLTEKFCEIFIIPIKEKTVLMGILIVLHDITEKKKIDQLKTDLIGNLSHELKTPIAILKGYIETIQLNPDDTESNSEYIAKALINLDRQNSIINDMLKLNMLETMTEMTFEKINLKDIISNCIEILGSKAKAKAIDINASVDLLNRQFDGNRFLAEEIFFNIILNAINYNNQNGRISINAAENNGRISVSITDTGIGIPRDSIDRIFERFYRVDKSRSRATGGTGLGLSIVKHAAEMQGWNISVDSDKSGTTFLIII